MRTCWGRHSPSGDSSDCSCVGITAELGKGQTSGTAPRLLGSLSPQRPKNLPSCQIPTRRQRHGPRNQLQETQGHTVGTSQGRGPRTGRTAGHRCPGPSPKACKTPRGPCGAPEVTPEDPGQGVSCCSPLCVALDVRGFFFF